jgi:hypothetical protein
MQLHDKLETEIEAFMQFPGLFVKAVLHETFGGDKAVPATV